MGVPIKIWFNKRFLLVFGLSTAIFTLILAVLVGFQYLTSGRPDYTPLDDGGQHIRVRPEWGSAKYPPELPSDFVPLYDNAKLSDLWVDTDGAGAFTYVSIRYHADASVDAVTAFYQKELGEAAQDGDFFSIPHRGMALTIDLYPDDHGTEVELSLVLPSEPPS